jgi:hypothetical protein
MRRCELLTAAGILALDGLFVLLDAGTSLRAAETEKRTWRLTVEADQPRLDYGTDNVEDIPIAFSCKPGRGVVDLWINETSTGVKPGRSMIASLTAGRTTSKVRGKTLPNEEAGTPSFEGTLRANDPIFTTLAKERSLIFVVGPSREQVPLGDRQQGRSVQSLVPEELRHWEGCTVEVHGLDLWRQIHTPQPRDVNDALSGIRFLSLNGFSARSPWS